MKQKVEKVVFPKWFRKLRLGQQILCIQSISSILVLGLLGLGLYLLFFYGQERISEIAEKILIEKILLRFSSRIVKYYQTRILQGFEECSDQLTYINQLYHFTIDNQLQFNYDVDQALLQNYTSYNPSIVWNSQFSYGIFGNESTSFNELDKLKLSNVLTQIQSLIPRKATLFFVGLSDLQYFSALPGNFFYRYVPHSRPWYAHHFTEYTYEKFPFSDPYSNYFGGVIITRTGNLTNLNNQLVGIIGNDMNITSFWGLNNIENAEIYLIDDEGRLILSPHYQEQQTEVDYIYDVHAVGFNQTDYKIIIQEIQQSNQVCSFQLESFFCLENKLNNKTYYINTYPIKRYRVIMRFEKEEYENQLKKLQAIKDQVQTYNSQIEYIVCGVTLIIFILLQWLTNSILQTPLERIMYCTKLVMNNNELPSIIQSLVTIGRNDQIDKLSRAFQNLIRLNRRRKSKGKYFQQLNNQIGFPENINIAYFKYDLINYKRLMSELQNKGKKQLSLVIKCLKFQNWRKSF